MAKFFFLFLSIYSLSAMAQQRDNITVRYFDEKGDGLSNGVDDGFAVDRFYLNHIIYLKGFFLSDIYSTVSLEEMEFITNETQ